VEYLNNFGPNKIESPDKVFAICEKKAEDL